VGRSRLYGVAPEIAQNGDTTEPLAMFATLGGSLALLLGLVVFMAATIHFYARCRRLRAEREANHAS